MRFDEMSEEQRRAIALKGSQASALKRAERAAAGIPYGRKPVPPKALYPLCKRGRHEMVPDNIGTTRRESGDGTVREQHYCKACRREAAVVRSARLRAIRRDQQWGRA